ncbi:MAG TPA: hypothetical protein PLT07_10770, partial [Trueperaceae bacterium]|nr:hypothetical protein [Trueperaceae bacterium]
MARIYAYAPQKAADLINQLVDADAPIEIGLEIQQQQRGEGSVPDGTIIQRSFKIVIETKVGAPVNVRQLVDHAGGFSDQEHKILLLLTRQPLGDAEERGIRRELAHAQAARGVIFSIVTFEDVIGALSGLFQPYEYEMNELVGDYVEYCWDAGLVDRSRFLLRIVPCGNSLEINVRHGIYFHPNDRGYSAHQYTGVYKDKRVQALWANESVFDVTLVDGKLDKQLVSGERTDEYDERLRAIIADAKTECGYEIATGHRFFCGTPHPTGFMKSSWGGIMGQRYVDVQEVVGDFQGAADLAD